MAPTSARLSSQYTNMKSEDSVNDMVLTENSVKPPLKIIGATQRLAPSSNIKQRNTTITASS